MNNGKVLRDESRRVIREIESIIEIVLLSLIYYYVWRIGYDNESAFPGYRFKGKYVLMGVYAAVMIFMFINTASLKQLTFLKKQKLIMLDII